MNGDHNYYNGASTPNAVAGPSKQPQMPSAPGNLNGIVGPPPVSSSSPPHRPTTPPVVALYLPPPAPPPPKLHLECTQDLLARFNLHLAYDRYVRPAVLPGNDPVVSGMGAGAASLSSDKGKGREMDVEMGEPGSGGGPQQGPGDADDDDGPGGKGEKKKKNSYRHLIKGLPGKHSMRKDDYLTTIMLVPPKQRVPIVPFDVHTQEDAFTVSPEGLKAWNINALVLESAQAREDRKKRKELKRMAKLQQQHGGADVPGSVGIPLRAPAPTVATGTPGARPSGTITPQRNPSTPRPAASRVGTPRPGSAVPKSAVPRPGSAMAQATAAGGGTQSTNQRPPVLRPGSTVPRPGSTAPPTSAGLPPRPSSTAGSVHSDAPRGKKRERDEGAPPNVGHTNGVNGGYGMGNGVTNGTASLGGTQSKPIVSAKAGNAGVRPRPVKKARMDGPGQSNPLIQQQPTPQGV